MSTGNKRNDLGDVAGLGPRSDEGSRIAPLTRPLKGGGGSCAADIFASRCTVLFFPPSSPAEPSRRSC